MNGQSQPWHRKSGLLVLLSWVLGVPRTRNTRAFRVSRQPLTDEKNIFTYYVNA